MLCTRLFQLPEQEIRVPSYKGVTDSNQCTITGDIVQIGNAQGSADAAYAYNANALFPANHFTMYLFFKIGSWNVNWEGRIARLSNGTEVNYKKKVILSTGNTVIYPSALSTSRYYYLMFASKNGTIFGAVGDSKETLSPVSVAYTSTQNVYLHLGGTLRYTNPIPFYNIRKSYVMSGSQLVWRWF